MLRNWISIHIFYASNTNPMLVEMVDPLIRSIRDRGLIQCYFFIKYWQEGPHLRLRILPAEGVKEEEIKPLIEGEIRDYLRRRPALYSAENPAAKAFYKDMFLTEYTQEKWDELYGNTGEMPLRPNNSFHYIAYEPEYDRYGGPKGIEVAEWHFEKSSEIVIKLIRDTNLHVRSILLGLSLQLSLPLCFCFLEDEQKASAFYANYRKFWLDSYHKDDPDPTPNFEKKYLHMEAELQRKVGDIHDYVVGGKSRGQTSFEREWLAHVREVKSRIDALIDKRELVFTGKRTGNTPFIPEKPEIAYNILLSSYVHMTNNRIGVLILDEIYLAYLIHRALEKRIQLQIPA